VTTAAPVLDSVLTCPQCGHAKSEFMPTEACQFFYECEQCKTVLRPLAGDCCVFCSYGSVACPPVQMRRGCSRCGA
jgi:rubredoxin